jgi:hypothetical protein
MKRIAFVTWCAGALGLWLVIGFGITRFSYAHMHFELPIWFRATATWVWHRFEPGYTPDALDMEDAAALVLFIAAHIISALIVMPLGAVGWRRIRASYH